MFFSCYAYFLSFLPTMTSKRKVGTYSSVWKRTKRKENDIVETNLKCLFDLLTLKQILHRRLTVLNFRPINTLCLRKMQTDIWTRVNLSLQNTLVTFLHNPSQIFIFYCLRAQLKSHFATLSSILANYVNEI